MLAVIGTLSGIAALIALALGHTGATTALATIVTATYIADLLRTRNPTPRP